MKWLTTLLLITFCYTIIAQSEELLETDITEVTVFLKKAQVTRAGSITLKKGEHLLKLKGISPYIDKKSIRFKANQNVSVLGLNYELDYLSIEKESAEEKEINHKIDSLAPILKNHEVLIEVINEDISFLRENRQVVNEEQAMTVSELKQHAAYQSDAMTTLKIKKIEQEAEHRRVKNELKKYFDEQQLYRDNQKALGVVSIIVDVKNNDDIPIEISYVTDNASWYPSYDIAVDDLDDPMILSYKANVVQNTKEDWDDISISFSSNDPNISSVAPELKTYYLNYGTRPPTYDESTNEVTGVVLDESGEPLIGANVAIRGTTIATITDFNGQFSLPKVNSEKWLTISFVGYESQDVLMSNDPMTVVLEEGALLEEVVVLGYGGARNKAIESFDSDLSGRVSGVSIRGVSSIPNAPLPVTLSETKTNVSFNIDRPYSIKSDNTASTITMVTIPIPVDYQYYSIPKINTNAYLITSIQDWEQYNFLSGQVNVVLDGTYIGSSILELAGVEETLHLSLGIDRSVSLSRERIKDYTDKRFLSKKQTESVGWKTTVKNNKEQAINIKVLDQVPVSTNDDIEVELAELSNASVDEENGTCTWIFDLSPNEQKELDLKYQVKYSKRRALSIE